MAYQSFDEEKGDSNSAAKLACLKLPDDLAGKTVLDIGCNEGYFVREALRRGATRAVGIDMSPDLIAKAKARVPEGEFHTMSWWDFGTEKFDYILFLSAIHYESKQRKLLTKLSYNLNPGGTLVLECGLVPERSEEWKLVNRHDGVFRFPTYGYLENVLLGSYSTRVIGKSVDQPGAPLGRYVLHCMVTEPQIQVVYGWSMSGKSSFCQSFSRAGMRVVNTDVVLTNAMQALAGSKDPFVRYVEKNLELGKIDLFCKKMVEDGQAAAFCNFVMRFISHDDEMTIVEGFPFVFPQVLEEFEKLGVSSGYRVSFTHLKGGKQSFPM